MIPFKMNRLWLWLSFIIVNNGDTSRSFRGWTLQTARMKSVPLLPKTKTNGLDVLAEKDALSPILNFMRGLGVKNWNYHFFLKNQASQVIYLQQIKCGVKKFPWSVNVCTILRRCLDENIPSVWSLFSDPGKQRSWKRSCPRVQWRNFTQVIFKNGNTS